MVKVENCKYSIYGNCVSISNGKVEVKVTTDVGPRIIYLAVDGGKNMMFEDIDDGIHSDFTYEDGTNVTWHIYGGHRLWKSEEEVATYAPDNYPVDVEYVDGGAIFTSRKEQLTGITKSVKVTMDDDGRITILHKILNTSDDVFNGALWALSVMAPGGKVFVPLNTANTGWLSNRNLVLWSYDNIKDDRLELRNDGIVITQDASVSEDNNLKIGTLTPLNYVYHLLPQGLFKKTFTPLVAGVKYPDNMCNVEVYTSFRMAEIETLSPMYSLNVGEEATHEEIWDVFSPDSATYKEVASRL